MVIFVDSNGEYTIQCAVYYITFEALDSGNIPLEYVQIVSYDNVTDIVLDFKITNSSGNAVSRLPAGQFDIYVYWHDVLVHTTTEFEVSGDTTKTLNCDVYYLTVRTVDSIDESIDTVHITIKDESGYIIGSNYTDSSGESVFRLASGDYVVEARYKTIYYLSNVDMAKTVAVSLNQSKTETITFEDYPISIYMTNAFIIGLIVIILITFFSYIMIRKYKGPAITTPIENDTSLEQNAMEDTSLLEEDIEELEI